MKGILLFFALLMAQISGLAASNVEWSEPQIRHIDGDNYELSIDAQIASGWKMYDMQNYVDGPNPTTFVFSNLNDVELLGEVISSPRAKRVWDDIFAQEIGLYEGKVRFSQNLRLLEGAKMASLELAVEWMTCSGMTCTPPEEEIFNLSFEAASNESLSSTTASSTASTTASKTTSKTASISQTNTQSVLPTKTIPSTDKTSAEEAGSSLWLLIVEAVLWGFAALLTPCVFPMVPLTISFFLKQSESPLRGRFMALLYGVFIVALYTLPIAVIILLTYLFGGDAVLTDIFNWVATHWLPNIVFFLVFMVFAASFFGAFELSLPASWVNKSDGQANVRSLGGVFFLALTLVLVSFSCTGPIVGSVLIKSVSGEFWEPIITMLAFSAAFALPFLVVALFPSFSSAMPKSGGWLSSVKVVLGFLELALGLKFLSVADGAYGWGLLPREVYLAIWIAIFSLLGFYLLGKLRFAHEKKLETLNFLRLFLSICVFSFVVYLLPGMWGAPLRALSGYLPPIEEQEFVIGRGSSSQAAPQQIDSQADGLKPFVNGLSAFYDLDEAQAFAFKENKPLLVFLTGKGCVNCREMEQKVLSNVRIDRLLREDFVLVALYMDDKRELPESKWITTDSGRMLKSVGRVNSYLALQKFGLNAQPYYIILGKAGQQIAPAQGYTLDKQKYIDFLERGLAAY